MPSSKFHPITDLEQDEFFKVSTRVEKVSLEDIPGSYQFELTAVQDKITLALNAIRSNSLITSVQHLKEARNIIYNLKQRK